MIKETQSLHPSPQCGVTQDTRLQVYYNIQQKCIDGVACEKTTPPSTLSCAKVVNFVITNGDYLLNIAIVRVHGGSESCGDLPVRDYWTQ